MWLPICLYGGLRHFGDGKIRHEILKDQLGPFAVVARCIFLPPVDKWLNDMMSRYF